jgi:histidyl-tRNA synthetase
MFTRIKGTQDFLDLSLFNFIIDQVKKHLDIYHFRQIDTPILEPTDLYKRSLGMQTDVVSKEMFLIKTKNEDDEGSICLRPEATASTVRAFVENNIDQLPWKVFSWGPMFRYERPQKGRYRQFHQINIEVIGSAAVAQDVQFIKMLDRYFSEKLMISNYALLLNYLGCPEDRQAYKVILNEFLQTPEAQAICPTCIERKDKNILRIFDCKTIECQKLYEQAPYLIDNLCPQCTQEWQQLRNDLELLSVSFVVNPRLVRGLDYYNKTVFEFSSGDLGAQNAFCGGGRYDQLVGQVGGKTDQPSIGAAMGIERLLLLLEPIKDSLALPQPPALQVILPMTPNLYPLALLLADELQAQQLCTEVLFDESIKNMLRKANKMGAQWALILGEDELKNNEVTVKNMITGTQERIAQAQVVKFLKAK